MAEKKKDLRVKKTQRALVTAMMTLLERQSFGKITVNDLCTEAMLSRSAFYTHFADKYALLRFCLMELKQSMFAMQEGQGMRAKIRGVLEKIQENVGIIRNLILAEVDVELMGMIRQTFAEDFERALAACEARGLELPAPADVVAVYYASAITGTIT